MICQWTYPAHLVFRCFSEEDNNNLAMRTGRAWTSHSSTARVLRAPASPAQVSVAASTRAPRRAGCNALHRDHATPRTRDTSVSLAGCARSAALAAPRHFPSLHLPDSHSLSHTSSPPRAQLRLRDAALRTRRVAPTAPPRFAPPTQKVWPRATRGRRSAHAGRDVVREHVAPSSGAFITACGDRASSAAPRPRPPPQTPRTPPTPTAARPRPRPASQTPCRAAA